MIWFYRTNIKPCVLGINDLVLHSPLWGLLRYHMSATEFWISHHKISLLKSLKWLNPFLTWICSANTWWTLHKMKLVSASNGHLEYVWSHPLHFSYGFLRKLSLLGTVCEQSISHNNQTLRGLCKHLESSLSIPHGRGACAIKTLMTDFRYRPSYWHVPPGAAMALEIRFYDITHECITGRDIHLVVESVLPGFSGKKLCCGP